MIRIGHLGTYEVIALVSIFGATDVFLSYPQVLAKEGGTAGWIIPLIAMVLALLIWMYIGPVLARLKGPILQDADGNVGWMSGVVALVGGAYFILKASSELRQFTETVVVTVLPKSPLEFIAIPFLLVIVYLAYQGLEGMSRVAWFFGFWFVLAITILLLATTNWIHPNFIFPLLGNGAVPVLVGGWSFLSAFTNIFLLTLMAPFLRERKQIVVGGFISILIIALVFSLVTLFFIMTFPIPGAEKAPFPVYQLSRLIYIGRFIQRTESAFIFIWVACAVIKMGVGLWMSSYLYATVFRMPVYRPMVFPMALLIYTVSLIPSNYVESYHLDTFLLMPWGWLVVIVLPIILVITTARARRKEGECEEKAPATT